MIADAAAGLSALLPHLDEPTERSFLDDLQEKMGDWRDRMHALESIEADPIQPQYLMHVIDRLADNDAILTSDSGTIATWAARHFTIRDDAPSTCRGTWPPWLPACRTRSPTRSPIPVGNASRLSATEGSPCSWRSSARRAATTCRSR